MFVMQLIENAFKILISSLSVLYKCDITVFNEINKINIFYYNFFSNNSFQFTKHASTFSCHLQLQMSLNGCTFEFSY